MGITIPPEANSSSANQEVKLNGAFPRSEEHDARLDSINVSLTFLQNIYNIILPFTPKIF
jgi:hypothetical protein